MFQPDQNVTSRGARFPGLGRVVQVRTLAGVDQAVVEVLSTGDFLTVPVDDLAEAEDVVSRLKAQRFDSAIAYDVRTQARFLDIVNRRTASLSAALVDVVPHQVLTADKVLSAQNPNHLLADDVGMGKTIEVGLVLKTLEARKQADRILIVVPAGLTLQWQEQLEELFGLYCDVFGRDFQDRRADTWTRYHRVIASIDAIKRHRRRSALEEAPRWDVLVVDEAHKLTARLEADETVRRTQNYQLLERLCPRARVALFATATPHQGDNARFSLLLHLLRPDLFGQRDPRGSLEAALPVLGDVMTRNRKSEATDLKGEPLFRGHDVVSVDVEPSEAETEFLAALQAYITLAYGYADHMGQSRARVLALVMTTFLKLASSSPAAVGSALENRLRYLVTGQRPRTCTRRDDEYDSRFEGEYLEDLEEITSTAAFFEEEVKHLKELVRLVRTLGDGEKAGHFLERVRTLRAEGDFEGGVLVFTEYRSTQQMLLRALQQAWPGEAVGLIRGGMGLDGKRAAVQRLAEEGGFLVSTEAGGEGLNMHRNCHVMFNFDLPWNPMRLQQRIGRLDRYGQQRRVAVFNLRTVGTIETRIRERLEEKLAAAMTALQAIQENPEDLREAILGTLEEELDLAAAYRRIVLNPRQARQTQRDLDRAVQRAGKAAERAARLFSAMGRFKADDWHRLEPEASLGDVEAWVRAYYRRRKLEEVSEGVYRLKTPDHLKQGRKIRATYDNLVFDRDLARKRPGAVLFTFGHPLFDLLIEDATRLEHGGLTAKRVGAARPGEPGTWGIQLNYIIGYKLGDGRESRVMTSVFVDQDLAIRRDIGAALRKSYSIRELPRVPRAFDEGFVEEAVRRAAEEAEAQLARVLTRTQGATPFVELYSGAVVQIDTEES